MRSLFLVSCMALVALVAASTVAPDAAVMSAPQVEDVTLLQMDSQATTTTSSVAALESQLAAALASQHAIESELSQEQSATIGAESEVDAEQLVEIEAQQQQQAVTDSESAAELEAQFEAEAEAEMELEADAESESQVDADADADADSETEAEVDTESEDRAEQESEVEQDSETDVDAEAEVDTEADSEDAPSTPVHRPRFTQKKKSKKAEKKVEQVANNPKAQREAREAKRKAKRAAKRAAFKAGMRAERSDPNAAPDVVHLPNGKKLFKSWIVSPNLKFEVPKAKEQKRHSKERVMTKFESEHYSQRAGVRQTQTQKHSDIRRAFLRLNPRLRKAGLRKLRKQYLRNLRRRSYSPAHAWGRALRAGKFASLKFDPPSNGGSSTQIVSQKLTIRQHAPSVRQRAEVSALRAATRTLRRINAKRREFKKALSALGKARAEISKQIHQHHVARALQAKKVAARAQRRAAWSALLQHRSLRKQLLKDIARAIRKGHLTGSARRQAIAALIKRNLSPRQRRRLHSYIKGRSGRRHRHAARRARHAKRAKRRAARKARKAASSAVKVGAVAKNGNGAESGKATKRINVKSAAPVLTEKDQRAIDALIKRIKAAINHPDTPRRQTKKAKAAAAAAASAGPAVASAAPISTTAKTAASTSSIKSNIRTPVIKVGAAAPVNTVAKTSASTASPKTARAPTPIRFQQLASAEQLAADAEAEALAELNTETEVDDVKDAPVLQLEAQVAAAAHETEEFMSEHHLE